MPSQDSAIGASGPGESGVCARPVGQTENTPPTISAMTPTDCHLRKLLTKAFDLECIGIRKSFGTVWSVAVSAAPYTDLRQRTGQVERALPPHPNPLPWGEGACPTITPAGHRAHPPTLLEKRITPQ